MASRAQVAVLVPTPPSTLNALRASPPPPKRRKTSHPGDEVSETFCTAQITIRAHGASFSSDGCQTLTPITVLSRSRLPLSWLDHGSNQSRRIQSGKLFTANIPALERDLRTVENEPVVLAAREETGGLYVVERVKQGIYAVCALGDWIEEGDLVVASEPCQRAQDQTMSPPPKELSTNCHGNGNSQANWLEAARIDEKLVNGRSFHPPEGTKVNVVFGPKGSSLDSKEGGDNEHTSSANDPGKSIEPFNTNSSGGSALDESKISSAEGSIARGKQPAPLNDNDIVGGTNDPYAKSERSQQEILDGLRKHYLDALYISKTSVAYFAKGPLSRARAAYQTQIGDASLHLSDLCSFYRDAIVPTKKMDTKYRDALPETVRKLSPDELDHGAETNAPKSKRRSAKRKKIGKNGLYAEEREYIASWWRNREVTHQAPNGQTVKDDDELKQLTGDLRIRETQLQILLILETMALESIISEHADMPQESNSKPTRPRKYQDLNTSLELLLDRLCIWHTVKIDDVIPDDSTTKNCDKNQSSGKPADNDKLRDFCKEVIMPFYAARLPEQCKAVSHKLGGPVPVSPARPGASQQMAGESQPGAAAKRPHHPDKPRRTLQRVVTDENVSRDKRPSLRQASTAPSAPALKRESSEPVILSQIKSARGGIQKAKHLDNREVDLDTVAKQHEAKLKKMNSLIEQKKELDSAINALRKPNRELVAKDFADTADWRSSASHHPRKPKNPVRNPPGQRVQVMATPKGPRKKDCGGGDALPPQTLSKRSQPSTTNETYLSEDDELGVPSSVSRPSNLAVRDSPVVNRNTTTTTNNITGVVETPSKAPSQQSNHLAAATTKDASAGQAPGTKHREGLFRVPSLPSLSRKSQGAPTPLRKSVSDVQESSDSRRESSLPPSAVQGTPERAKLPASSHRGRASPLQHPAPNSAVVPSTPTKTKPANTSASANETTRRESATAAANSTSIYDQLGWNNNDDDNDDDDELAL